jgi:hypothetical protein
MHLGWTVVLVALISCALYLPCATKPVIEPFSVRFPDEALLDLRQRLLLSRFPPAHAGDDTWQLGASLSYMKNLHAFWLNNYSWRDTEERLKGYNHFKVNLTSATGVPATVHFIRIEARIADPLPMLMLHGWPGSFFEFLEAAEELRDQYELIIPSLPGFGFSSPNLGMDANDEIPSIMQALMVEALEFTRGYVVQGGDWGAQIATNLCNNDRTHCLGHHINFRCVS